MCVIDNIAENAGRVRAILEAIDDTCCVGDITLDEVRALSQYALTYNEKVFICLDKL